MFLSISAVALCCGLLITVSSLFNSFIDEIKNSTKEQIGDVTLYGPFSSKINNYEKLVEMLEDCGAVEGAAGVLNSQGLLLIGKGNVRAVSIMGIEPWAREKISTWGGTLLRQAPGVDAGDGGDISFAVPGREDDSTGGFVGIGLLNVGKGAGGYDRQEAMGYIGAPMILTTGTFGGGAMSGAASRSDLKARSFRFYVSDVLETGINELDGSFIFVPIGVLSEKIYGSDEALADTIQIRLAEGFAGPEKIETAAAMIRGIWESFAREHTDIDEYLIRSARVETSSEMQRVMIGEYQKQLAVLMAIFGMISAGVVMLIGCIFYMIVVTKSRDIAIIKSCGMGFGSTMGVFVVFGAVIGFIGAAVGAGLGVVIVKNINTLEDLASGVLGRQLWQGGTYMFDKIPGEVDYAALGWIFAAAVIAAVLGAVIPATGAARVEPVKILRYE